MIKSISFPFFCFWFKMLVLSDVTLPVVVSLVSPSEFYGTSSASQWEQFKESQSPFWFLSRDTPTVSNSNRTGNTDASTALPTYVLWTMTVSRRESLSERQAQTEVRNGSAQRRGRCDIMERPGFNSWVCEFQVKGSWASPLTLLLWISFSVKKEMQYFLESADKITDENKSMLYQNLWV